jgi:hypothetical protein
MMNPIEIRTKERIGSRDWWFGGGTPAAPVPEHGGAGPGGTTVRRSAWRGWRSATGRSCGRPAPAGPASTWPSTMSRSPPDESLAAPASALGPSSAAHPGSAPRDARPHTLTAGGVPRHPAADPGARPHTRRSAPAPGRAPHSSPVAPADPGGALGRPSGSAPRRPVARVAGGRRCSSGWPCPRWAGGRWRRGRACTSCRSRRGRVGCGRPSCRPGVGPGWWWRRGPRLR